jgi:2-amino-4-hydroxy-6-hydroxymethyldihydropteridine diphosphokinase
LLADSELPAIEILRLAHDAEQALGRVRDQRWGPRTLDVDLIACDDEVTSDAELTLPHLRAHERAFVLLPWLDVDPGAHLVGFGPVADLLARADQTGVTRLADQSLKVSAMKKAAVKKAAVKKAAVKKAAVKKADVKNSDAGSDAD